jgi:hypothetical protein
MTTKKELPSGEELRLEWLHELKQAREWRPGPNEFFCASPIGEKIRSKHKMKFNKELEDIVSNSLLQENLVRAVDNDGEIYLQITQEGLEYIRQAEKHDILINQNLKNTNNGDSNWLKNLITLIVLLGLGLSGFYLLEPFPAVLWFLFVLVATPVVLAFVQSSGKFTPKNLIDLYRLGVKQLPFIGDILARLFFKK